MVSKSKNFWMKTIESIFIYIPNWFCHFTRICFSNSNFQEQIDLIITTNSDTKFCNPFAQSRVRRAKIPVFPQKHFLSTVIHFFQALRPAARPDSPIMQSWLHLSSQLGFSVLCPFIPFLLILPPSLVFLYDTNGTAWIFDQSYFKCLVSRRAWFARASSRDDWWSSLTMLRSENVFVFWHFLGAINLSHSWTLLTSFSSRSTLLALFPSN